MFDVAFAGYLAIPVIHSVQSLWGLSLQSMYPIESNGVPKSSRH